jgi:two-component system sensor histidine kinase ChvG
VSPLLRRILLVNALPLALLVAALLYLDQYQNGLLQAEVLALREQARIFAGALGESAVTGTADNPKISPEIARPLLRRLTEPTPDAQAKLYAPDGSVIADSRVREGAGGAVANEPLPPPVDRGRLLGLVGWLYDEITRRRRRSWWTRGRALPAWTGSRT